MQIGSKHLQLTSIPGTKNLQPRLNVLTFLYNICWFNIACKTTSDQHFLLGECRSAVERRSAPYPSLL